MRRSQVAWNILCPVAFGVTAFFIVAGHRALDPTNLALFDDPDSVVGYLGWRFFRFSAWSFPLGLNPNYGLELSNAILFSDSNPLLAFLFKPFSALLPVPFQYTGIWLLACFVLQAWFGWQLAGLVTDHPALRLPAMGLFVFAPPFLFRLNGHFNLAGHFLILAALYLVLHTAPRRRRLAWGSLLVAAALVHAYLLAMAGALWLADLAERRRREALAWCRVLSEFVLLMVMVGLACWQSGYFSVGDGTTEGGYGFYRLNLLSPLDANGWSFVLPDIAQGPGDGEGFNFLGSGVLLLLAAGLPALVRGRAGVMAGIRRRPFLAAALAGMSVYALSHRIGVGALELNYPLPAALVALANTFRASGRIFWPVFYTIVWGAVFWTVRGWSRSAAAWILAAACLIQAADTRAGWRVLRSGLMREPSSILETALRDPFWEQAAAIYRKVRWVPPQRVSPRWRDLAVYAAVNGLATDAAYLARVGRSALERARGRAAAALATGRYEADALYVLDDSLAIEAASNPALIRFDPRADVLARVDGFNVLAPGWRLRPERPPFGADLAWGNGAAALASGRKLFLGRAGAAAAHLLSDGWSTPEDWGTWSDGPQAEIRIPVSAHIRAIRLEAMALVAPQHPRQTVTVRIHDREVSTFVLRESAGNIVEVAVPEEARGPSTADGVLRLRLIFHNAARPVDLGLNDDRRTLAVGVQVISVF